MDNLQEQKNPQNNSYEINQKQLNEKIKGDGMNIQLNNNFHENKFNNRNEIEEQDKKYILYLKTEKVLFSDGDVVNLENNDFDCVCKELAKRIYKTRNALVHSKELESSKYKPFHDDKILLKEMLLLRLLAEQVIIKTSQIL